MTDSIQAWLAAFPAQDAAARLRSLEGERAKIDRDIEQIRRLIDALGAVPTNGNGNGHGQQSEEPTTLALPLDRPKGMEAVEAVMRREPRRPWKRAEINAAMVDLGWLAPGEPGRKTLGSILHRMAKSGRIVNRETGSGIYELPSVETEVVAR